MQPTLASFQSAVQLVSGANLAVFALPRLGQAKVDIEEQCWRSVLMVLKEKNAGLALLALRDYSKLSTDRYAIDLKTLTVRRFALMVSVISALYLVWCSYLPDNNPDFWTYGVLIAGSFPSIWLTLAQSDLASVVDDSRTAWKHYE
jgi:hypothetical protein